MLESVLSGIVGLGGALLGAGVAWGMLREKVQNLATWIADTREGVARVESRCKERDEALSDGLDVVRADLRVTTAKIDGHIASHRGAH